ncbi:hypothetical protein [Gilvimarinus sp. 1_MG-2023]|uniref:hypothetical protein n=1 Tax=Gilvimarinus sp. 1_MG-2023 TaxID=3062638 RepID=UPI0026E1F944|nr:hypothetical protein [Gilvimarinus sp. 1_MG-2023]MDO6746393.1 hypothetical protein [Gilvimarinus sp. 1_MG-2023]
MKTSLRKVFKPLLAPLEAGTEPYHYKPLSRKVLFFFGAVFTFLGLLAAWLIPEGADLGYYFPVLVFTLAGLYGLIVGALGEDRAVARIWGNK